MIMIVIIMAMIDDNDSYYNNKYDDNDSYHNNNYDDNDRNYNGDDWCCCCW